MLSERIAGAFTFRRGVYSEVERDTAFTSTAWILVVVVAFLNQLGASATAGGVGGWLIGSILGTIGTVIGFAVGAWVINWVGRSVFDADVTFDELVRTLGLAYVWNVVGVLGILGAVSDTLGCLVAPVTVAAALLGLAAWLVATKEALDLEWVQTIVTVVIGWIVLIVIMIITGIVVGILGFGAAALGGAFSS